MNEQNTPFYWLTMLEGWLKKSGPIRTQQDGSKTVTKVIESVTALPVSNEESKKKKII